MGVVYRAEDVRLQRAVALKVLPPDQVGDEEHRLRFLREARAAAAVSHPNIATVYEVGDEGGVIFIAMELLEGRTLRSLIAERPLPTKDVVRIGAAVADGLARAHQARIIHRDLKPDNIFLTSDRQVKILDFGLAKPLEAGRGAEDASSSRLQTISAEMTRAGRIVGTAAYMSPEQARGDVIDTRSDIFSLGIVLYEIASGMRPFRGRTTTDTLTAILRDQPAPLAQVNPDIPPELERIVDKCLAKDPDERYQHADEAAVDLKRLRRVIDSGAHTIATPSGRSTVTGSARRAGTARTRFARGAIIGVLAAALVAGGIVLWRSTHTVGTFRSGDRVIVADFENSTGLPQLDSAVRDSFENMLASSAFLHVIKGDGRKQLLRLNKGTDATDVTREIADRSCGGGRCEGVVSGRIEREGSGYRLQAALFRVGGRRPAIALSSTAASESEILMTLHRMALDMRRSLGESPQALAGFSPPTTQSVQAYQAYSIANTVDNPAERPALLRKAVEIDPEFVAAYADLATQCWNVGRCREYRQFAEEAYRRSSPLPERDRLLNETIYLDASYDFDTEIERLKRFRRLYPLDSVATNFLASLYFEQEDLVSAEAYAREAYLLFPDANNLSQLAGALSLQGKLEETEHVVADFRAKGGSEDPAEFTQAVVYLYRGDRDRLGQSLSSLERKPGNLRLGALRRRLYVLLADGKLARARGALPPLLQAAQDLYGRAWQWQADAVLDRLWLESRDSKQPKTSLAEFESAKECLRDLPSIAVLQVDLGSEGPLAALIAAHEIAERGSKSRFVKEELQFARGCLMLVRGDAASARRYLEPLTHTANLVRRHRMLARVFEALKEWDAAAREYEQALENPYRKWASNNPAEWVLDQFRLALVYERLGNPNDARRWYGRFLADWKDADPGIPEVAEARERVARLPDTVNRKD